MSQAAENETAFASGRYSKRKRTQVNYRMEELDVDGTDIESEEEAKPKKQRKTAASRPLSKRKIFPFLQLPAEIRNMIYNYALMEPAGCRFVAVQRHRRRCVERVSTKTFEEVAADSVHYRRSTLYQPQGINGRAEEQAASLTPSLLAVNKQIHREGCDFLYGNELVFADSIALYSFMINLGPGSAFRLKKMTIKNWDYGRTSKAYNNACFAALVWAVNLEKLYIDVGEAWYNEPKHAAQQLYRDAFPWLEAVGRSRGKYDAAVDVVEVNAECLGGRYRGSQSRTDAEKLKMFNDELSKNLGAQHKRVMASSTKKRKIAKVSG